MDAFNTLNGIAKVAVTQYTTLCMVNVLERKITQRRTAINRVGYRFQERFYLAESVCLFDRDPNNLRGVSNRDLA